MTNDSDCLQSPSEAHGSLGFHGPAYVSVRTSWLFLSGTPRGYPRNAPLHGHRPAASSCMKAENWALSIWMVSGKQASMMAPCSQSR